MKNILVLIVGTLLIGCGGLIKSGGIFEAQNALDKNDFSSALEHTGIAESFGNLSSQQTAKLHYIRAQALEGLGQLDKAKFNYDYVVAQHPNSAYANPSRSRLKAINSKFLN